MDEFVKVIEVAGVAKDVEFVKFCVSSKKWL